MKTKEELPYTIEQLAPLGIGHGRATGKQSLRLTGSIQGHKAVVEVRHNMEYPQLFRFECELADESEGSLQHIGHASGNIGATDDINLAADAAWRLCDNYPYKRGSPYFLNREVVTP